MYEPSAAPLTSSKKARERVLQARQRQSARLTDDGVSVNAHMNARILTRHIRLDARSQEMLREAHRMGMLSARGQHRVLRVARTIADLRGSRSVSARDVGAAIALRTESGLAGMRAA